jgi:uncharacterized protein YdhG (YjbR/CyaY superfamily)
MFIKFQQLENIEPLMKSKIKTIDEYITSSPEDIQPILKKFRDAIREVAPQATETISWQMPTFKLNGYLVHFAAFKKHIGFYPAGTSVIEMYRDKLTDYKTSKGAVQFPLDKPLPIDLIKEMVRFRVKENLAKK